LTEPTMRRSEAGKLRRSPAVSSVWQSAQLGVPHVDVMAGDTCSSSADGPVPSSGDPMTGLSLHQLTSTGAWHGTPQGAGNPTAGVGLDGVRP
jgi:hypothetical protein